jgi:hypothetical protein
MLLESYNLLTSTAHAAENPAYSKTISCLQGLDTYVQHPLCKVLGLLVDSEK